MPWPEGLLEEALARARAEDRRLAVKFEASWCGMCDELDRDVLSTRAGDALFGALVTLRVDFDAIDAHPLIERFAILDLPTVLVFESDGTEVARLVGYDEPRAWIDDARAAIVASDPVPALRRTLEQRADDADAMLALGELLLSRAPDEGAAMLDRLAWRNDERAERALFLLGRFHHRVRRDPEKARTIWRELATRFSSGEHAEGAWWWHARAQAELGRVELGAEALEARVRHHGGGADAILAWGRFVGRHAFEPARDAVRAAAMQALATARGDMRDQLEELVLALGRPLR